MLVLASTSPYRRELLARLAVPFEVADPGLDEEPWKQKGLSPDDLVVQLALAKAEAVAASRPGDHVIGADQVAVLDGEILGKPGTNERAVEQLLRLAGREHRLVTGVALVGPEGWSRTAVDVQEMRMRPFGRPAAERYVAEEEVRNCAGSYRIEGLGIRLFARMRSEDWTGIVGLPLLLVSRLLAEAGLDPLGAPTTSVRERARASGRDVGVVESGARDQGPA